MLDCIRSVILVLVLLVVMPSTVVGDANPVGEISPPYCSLYLLNLARMGQVMFPERGRGSWIVGEGVASFEDYIEQLRRGLNIEEIEEIARLNGYYFPDGIPAASTDAVESEIDELLRR